MELLEWLSTNAQTFDPQKMLDNAAQDLLRNLSPKVWKSAFDQCKDTSLLSSVLRAISPIFKSYHPETQSESDRQLFGDLGLDENSIRMADAGSYVWQMLPLQFSIPMQKCLRTAIMSTSQRHSTVLTDQHAKMVFVPVMQWLELRTCRHDHDLSTVGLELAQLCHVFATELSKLMPPQLVSAMGESILQMLWTLQVLSPSNDTAISITETVVDTIELYVASLYGCRPESSSVVEIETVCERSLVALIGWLGWSLPSASSRRSCRLDSVLLKYALMFYVDSGSRALFHVGKIVETLVDVMLLHGPDYAPINEKSLDSANSNPNVTRSLCVEFLNSIYISEENSNADDHSMASIMWEQYASVLLALCAQVHIEPAETSDPLLLDWKDKVVASLINLNGSEQLRADIIALSYLGHPFSATCTGRISR